MRRAVQFIVAAVLAVGALLFSLAFYDRYWRWRGCFNELGRCWDSRSEQVFLEQAGLVWGMFAGVFFLLLALFVLSLFRRR